MEFSLIKISAAAIGLLFTTEYVCKKKKTQYKPSTAMTYVANKTVDLFRTLGGYIAKLSSFYTYLNLGDIAETFKDLFRPVFLFITSPFQMAYGYITTIELSKYSFKTIFLGTFTILALLALFQYKIGFSVVLNSITNLRSVSSIPLTNE